MADELEYIQAPIEADRDEMAQEAFDFIKSKWPNWDENEGDFEAWFIAALVRIVAEAIEMGSDVPSTIIAYLGKWVFRVPLIEAVSAEVTSTWILNANPAGRTIEAGDSVLIDGIPFEVASPVVLAPGDLVTNDGQVTLRAVTPGTAGTGLGGLNVEAELLDPPYDWVDSITLEGPTTGGKDEETPEDYLDRISTRLTIYRPAVVVDKDFAIWARDLALQKGVVARVLALDLYNPVTNSWNNDKYVTLVMIDDVTGADLSTDVKDFIQDEIQKMREVNFVLPIINANKSSVHVNYAGVVSDGEIPAEIKIAVDESIEQFLLSINWGRTTSGLWKNQPVVRFQDLSAVLNAVPGFDHWTSLTFAVGAGPQNQSDKTLPGVAPLTQPGAIVGVMS